MTSQHEGYCCKIGRIVSEYELSDVDSRLAKDWQSGTSVRQLAENLNKEIIEAALTAVNASQVQWSRTPIYEALRTDELSDAEEIQIRRELDRTGVELEKLSSDLVSHQTVYRHLTQCLDISKDNEKTPEERIETAKETVFALQQRTEAVTENTIETLQTADVTDIGEPEVLVDIRVVCEECGRSVDFQTAISNGCHCNND